MTFLLHAFKDIRFGNDCRADGMYFDELIVAYAEAWNLITFELFPIYKAQRDCILSRPIGQDVILLNNAIKYSHATGH